MTSEVSMPVTDLTLLTIDDGSDDFSSDTDSASTTETPPVTGPLSLGICDQECDSLSSSCNACPHCEDVCEVPFCRDCSVLRKTPSSSVASSSCLSLATNLTSREVSRRGGGSDLSPGRTTEPCYTLCQVRRHNHTDSAWLVADGIIYDATSYLSLHPGGERSLLRKAGGVADCAEDMRMHSRGAVRMWKDRRVGRVCTCPAQRGMKDDMPSDIIVGGQELCTIC